MRSNEAKQSRPESERFATKRHLYHFLEQHDIHHLKLDRLRDQIIATHQHNEAALAAGALAEVQPLPVEQFIPRIQRYPVSLSRRGQLYTNDLSAHYYLPHRRDVPGVLAFTAGDLHAAAQWELLPQLESGPRAAPTEKDPHYQHLRQAYHIINEVELFSILRQIYNKKHLYDDQLWDVTTEIWEQPDAAQHDWRRRLLTNGPEDLTAPVDQAALDQYLRRPSQLAERLAFTLLARLGSRVEPAFTIFEPRAGVDRFKKVDVLARFTPAQQAPWLVGLDITTTTNSRTIWEKHLHLEYEAKKMATTPDPITFEKFPLYRDLVVWPAPAQPLAIYERWEKQRGTTALTPEYCMTPAQRQAFVSNLMKRLCQPTGERVYDDQTITAVYQTVYGQFDERQAAVPNTKA